MHLSRSKAFPAALRDISTNRVRQRGLQMEDGTQQEQTDRKNKDQAAAEST